VQYVIASFLSKGRLNIRECRLVTMNWALKSNITVVEKGSVEINI